MPVVHAKYSTVSDGPDANEVQPSDWNAGHRLVATVPIQGDLDDSLVSNLQLRMNGDPVMDYKTTVAGHVKFTRYLFGTAVADPIFINVANGKVTFEGMATDIAAAVAAKVDATTNAYKLYGTGAGGVAAQYSVDKAVATVKPAYDVLPVTGNALNEWGSLIYGHIMADVPTRGTIGTGNGAARAVRIYVPRSTTLTLASFVSTVGSAGQKQHSGLYTVNASTGLLGTLVQDFGEIALDGATGKRVYPNTATVDAGEYWLYYNSNAAVAVFATVYHANASSGTGLVPSRVNEAFLTGTTGISVRLEGTVTYTTAVPTTAPVALVRGVVAPNGAPDLSFFQGT